MWRKFSTCERTQLAKSRYAHPTALQVLPNSNSPSFLPDPGMAARHALALRRVYGDRWLPALLRSIVVLLAYYLGSSLWL